MVYLDTAIRGDLGMKPCGNDPSVERKQPPHAIQHRQERTNRKGEDVQPTDEIFRQNLEREKEQVWSGSSHGSLVSSRKPSQHISQRQEQPYHRAQHHVELEQPVSLEHHQSLRFPVVRKHETRQQERVD